MAPSSPSLRAGLKSPKTAFGSVPTYQSLVAADAAEHFLQSAINLYGCFGDVPWYLAMTAIERLPVCGWFPWKSANAALLKSTELSWTSTMGTFETAVNDRSQAHTLRVNRANGDCYWCGSPSVDELSQEILAFKINHLGQLIATNYIDNNRRSWNGYFQLLRLEIHIECIVSEILQFRSKYSSSHKKPTVLSFGLFWLQKLL